MAIYLETLEHQQKAIDAIVGVMEGCCDFDEKSDSSYANPTIKLRAENVRKFVEKSTKPSSFNLDSNNIIDIKMETGTGKTFVYTKTMYELYKNFELNKLFLCQAWRLKKARRISFQQIIRDDIFRLFILI